MTKDEKKFIKWIIGGIVALIVCIIVLCNSLTIVPVGHTGVILHFGATTSKTLDDGWHFKIPFVESIVDVSNKVMKSDVSANSTSKDLQAITCNISINYHLAAENSADMYKNVGLAYDDTLLQPAIQEAVKAVMARYSAEELITNRSAVGIEIGDEIRNKVTIYGIIIDEFNLTNFNFSAEFNAAIEAKQIAEQDKIKAETEKERRTIEAEAAAAEKTIAAEADAEAILAQAEAEAEAIRVKAEAEAEANKKINESLTENVLKYSQIETWNGEYPSVVSGDATSMLIDIPSK